MIRERMIRLCTVPWPRSMHEWALAGGSEIDEEVEEIKQIKQIKQIEEIEEIKEILLYFIIRNVSYCMLIKCR